MVLKAGSAKTPRCPLGTSRGSPEKCGVFECLYYFTDWKKRMYNNDYSVHRVHCTVAVCTQKQLCGYPDAPRGRKKYKAKACMFHSFRICCQIYLWAIN